MGWNRKHEVWKQIPLCGILQRFERRRTGVIQWPTTERLH